MQVVESKENTEKKSSENCNSDEVKHRFEVTPEMLVEGIWAANLHWPETEGYEELVKDVYRAMESERQRIQSGLNMEC